MHLLLARLLQPQRQQWLRPRLKLKRRHMRKRLGACRRSTSNSWLLRHFNIKWRCKPLPLPQRWAMDRRLLRQPLHSSNSC